MVICSNCGERVKDDAQFCLSCGCEIKQKPMVKEVKNENGRTISTLTVVFGALGFWPLIIIGSIIGIVLYIISKNVDNNEFDKRARIGLALSVGSLLLYIAAFIMLIVVVIYA